MPVPIPGSMAEFEPAPTHFVRWDEPGRIKAQAICGTWVDRRREHAIAPTCPDCQREKARMESFDLNALDDAEAPQP
jgi:hypothetical protein